MTKPRLALQLYSLRADCAEDLPAAIRDVGKMGYDGVEFAGFHGRTAGEVKRLVADAGLVPASAHHGITEFALYNMERLADFHSELGTRHIALSGLWGEYHGLVSGYLHGADLISRMAEVLKPRGMRIGFHLHGGDLAKGEDGRSLWDVFFDAVSPDVTMQVDTGNAWHEGIDPVELLARHPGRSATVHLKASKAKRRNLSIGEDDVPWSKIFAWCGEKEKTEWYIVEQEEYQEGMTPKACVKLALDNLRKMGV